MKTFRSLSVLCALLACCAVLSGCLSHWCVDSSTRLQIENKSSKTIIGVDIVSVFMHCAFCIHYSAPFLLHGLRRSCDATGNCGCSGHLWAGQVDF